MPVKIRLQRHGKKGKPFYWIVAADARSKRDGRYLEKLGTYNPNTNPATVEIQIDNAIDWLEKGAQPTDTARTLLSYKGVLFKHHLNGGIRKGALTEEQAEKKFTAWLEEKEAKIQVKKEGLTKQEQDAKAKRLSDEKAVSEKRLAEASAAAAEAEANEAS
ncbi:MAG: 30S ribosomal protein S16, partial [Flavobacteriaceae bacterium]